MGDVPSTRVTGGVIPQKYGISGAKQGEDPRSGNGKEGEDRLGGCRRMSTRMSMYLPTRDIEPTSQACYCTVLYCTLLYIAYTSQRVVKSLVPQLPIRFLQRVVKSFSPSIRFCIPHMRLRVWPNDPTSSSYSPTISDSPTLVAMAGRSGLPTSTSWLRMACDLQVCVSVFLCFCVLSKPRPPRGPSPRRLNP